ncbi:MaoC/PaaZ C-terminal domain-containing protein [Pseudodesulfovibrio sp. zrk46]|uniref:MaoC/PaaZ C-terminal domain-containing protein n=1 Tax=Pseudodesulfovibrio sp. zrk46 TaxID=2725288 RepID=UPI001449089D|nr:MaoC/PaaZ C-terminal domain-containing protein [Pseudodesulfovibrio sp. zrk46]QJB56589.1 hypothetical protein HFN16_09285 [Pseudodesulfovibrio sp. zrk46]
MERIFTAQDQGLFAQLSGDRNPVHVDPEAARRTLFGNVVVHGVHMLLWALDCAFKDQEAAVIESVSAHFMKSLEVGEAVCTNHEWNEDTLTVELLRDGELVLKGQVVISAPDEAFGKGIGAIEVKDEVQHLTSADLESECSGEFELAYDGQVGKELFPELVEKIPQRQLASLLGATRVVGMRCPGLHSIFSRLDLKKSSMDDSSVVRYSVGRFEPRFSLVEVDYNASGLEGRIHAFLRPAPVEQPSCATIAAHVEEGEFAHIKGLVVAGSRGLGEVVTKLLAAGGADVRFTFHSGEKDAHALQAEVRGCGGACEAFKLDVLAPEEGIQAIQKDDWHPTHMFYFATPKIAESEGTLFSHEDFQRFSSYYVDALFKLVETVEKASQIHVFNPSTVFVDNCPHGLAAYAAAKASSEFLCRHLHEAKRVAEVSMPRLPKMKTDQTNSLIPTQREEPLAVMLKALRDVVAKDKK